MNTAIFWKRAAERSVKTFAQTFISVVGVSAFDVLHFAWTSSLSVSAGAALLSVLTSVVSAPVTGDSESPSLVK